MRKALASILVVCIIAILAVSVSAVMGPGNSSRHGKPLFCTEEMAYDVWSDGAYWKGTLTGDMQGTVRFWEQPQNYVEGSTEYFFETFVITTARGVVQGHDEGVYNLNTGEFWANGVVTAASGYWAYLEGYQIYEMGWTSLPSSGLPITAHNIPVVLVPESEG